MSRGCCRPVGRALFACNKPKLTHGDGFTGFTGDCDDLDANVHPDAEVCENGIDDNCNGIEDEEGATSGRVCVDLDGDGYGSDEYTQMACNQPDGFAAEKWDCQEDNAEINSVPRRSVTLLTMTATARSTKAPRSMPPRGTPTATATALAAMPRRTGAASLPWTGTSRKAETATIATLLGALAPRSCARQTSTRTATARPTTSMRSDAPTTTRMRTEMDSRVPRPATVSRWNPLCSSRRMTATTSR